MVLALLHAQLVQSPAASNASFNRLAKAINSLGSASMYAPWALMQQISQLPPMELLLLPSAAATVHLFAPTASLPPYAFNVSAAHTFTPRLSTEHCRELVLMPAQVDFTQL